MILVLKSEIKAFKDAFFHVNLKEGVCNTEQRLEFTKTGIRQCALLIQAAQSFFPADIWNFFISKHLPPKHNIRATLLLCFERPHY